jgi:hypothetical protein
MVMNRTAFLLLRTAGKVTVTSHDWWAYMLISGAGGRIIYDAEPSIHYRQHEKNSVGANNSWSARFIRVNLLLQGRFRDWSSTNIVSLENNSELLSSEARITLDNFRHGRERWLVPRLWKIWRSGVHRQTLLGNLGLFAAVLFKKI